MATDQLNDRSTQVPATAAATPMAPVPDRALPLRRLADQLEASDPYTSGHSRRVARYSTLVGAQIGMAGGELRRLRTAAMLHDVGPRSCVTTTSGSTAAATPTAWRASRSRSARA